ncbi:Uncharacterized protein C20orf195, partial [Buceros rhinoceros silvestris]
TFGSMDASQDEPESRLESPAQSEDQADAAHRLYRKRRVYVLQFLHRYLSPQHLQQYQHHIELLKKSCFYLDVEPKHVMVTLLNGVVRHTDIFQLINPYQFLRMKNLGKTQTEVQLSLLTALLEQLERGREELSSYVKTYDMVTFLSRWDLIVQRMVKLSKSMEKLIFLQMPGKLYVKHRLVFPLEVELGSMVLPNISLSLYTKTPPIFDRKESVAFNDWAELKWFTKSEEPCDELYELHVELVTAEGAMETGYGRVQTVPSKSCVVKHLQPNRVYEFRIKRAVTHTLVCQRWHDSIILETK